MKKNLEKFLKVIYRVFGKRVFDIFLSFLLFVMLFPIFIVLVIVLSIYFKGSPFFFQERPGMGNRIFKIIKFKTMRDAIDGNGFVRSDEKRIPFVGKLIRKSSLDEIPQLINVLKGDMSLVGPRPLLPEYLSIYSIYQIRRHEIKPGVTGWAQVNGRNAVAWTKKFEFDIWYVENYSFALDLKILWLTFWNVLQGKGVSQRGHVTVGKFTGVN